MNNADLFDKLAHSGYADETSFLLKDINGNVVGYCKVEE